MTFFSAFSKDKAKSCIPSVTILSHKSCIATSGIGILNIIDKQKKEKKKIKNRKVYLKRKEKEREKLRKKEQEKEHNEDNTNNNNQLHINSNSNNNISIREDNDDLLTIEEQIAVGLIQCDEQD
jgi:hypothetical protein